MRIVDRRVLITGAGRGLGKAIASAFAQAGALVLITDRDPDRVVQAVADLEATERRVYGYTLDVTSPDQVTGLRSRIHAEHGPIDVLINNAGVVHGGRFQDVPLSQHEATIHVNLAGVLAVTHAFLPDLIARPSAQVVNIASASAVVALPFAASYAATKWAVLGFSDSLREELHVSGHRHVTVTAICPSFITTGLFKGARPARFTDWLTPEAVAVAVRRSVERRRSFVLLPWPVSLLYATCRCLPRDWYASVCRRLGVSTSMMGWNGHADD